jgi:Zn-dependent protease with chaperone function
MRIFLLIFLGLGLAGCATVVPMQPTPQPAPQVTPASTLPSGLPSAREAADNFVAVLDRVEPVAERICRAEAPGLACDYQIVVDGRVEMPPNAFQTVDEAGRPIIAFTIALVAEARNQDELALILGHEAAHHIAGHLPRQRDSAVRGAVLAGVLASLGGGDALAIERAQQVGATVGARAYSKDFELEADALGTVIAYRAGYDPLIGAQYFNRIEDPGNRFLGSHPPNASRIETVQRTLAQLRAGG